MTRRTMADYEARNANANGNTTASANTATAANTKPTNIDLLRHWADEMKVMAEGREDSDSRRGGDGGGGDGGEGGGGEGAGRDEQSVGGGESNGHRSRDEDHQFREGKDDHRSETDVADAHARKALRREMRLKEKKRQKETKRDRMMEEVEMVSTEKGGPEEALLMAKDEEDQANREKKRAQSRSKVIDMLMKTNTLDDAVENDINALDPRRIRSAQASAGGHDEAKDASPTDQRRVRSAGNRISAAAAAAAAAKSDSKAASHAPSSYGADLRLRRRSSSTTRSNIDLFKPKEVDLEEFYRSKLKEREKKPHVPKAEDCLKNAETLKNAARLARDGYDDVSTGPLARPFAHSLIRPHRSLIRLLRTAHLAPLRTFLRSLAHTLTPELMGKCII